jgi:hypothetical protein
MHQVYRTCHALVVVAAKSMLSSSCDSVTSRRQMLRQMRRVIHVSRVQGPGCEFA